MIKRLLGIIIPVLLLLYFITLVLHISANNSGYQWDFRSHRQAGELIMRGENPYDPSLMSTDADTGFLYTYPPLTLIVYRLLASIDYVSAFHVFLIVKCILLFALIFLWKKEFLKKDADFLFYLFCLFAFHSTLYLDLIAGNVNLIEELMLWLAFCFYLRGRLLLFCVFTVLAASFKMVPIFFLVLLLLTDNSRKYRYFIGTAAAFAAYLLVQFIAVPEMFKGFITNALTVVGERGVIVPSTYTLVNDIFSPLLKSADSAGVQYLPKVIVLLITALVVFVSYKAYRRLRQSQMKEKEKLVLFLVCVVYALIHPRYKDYAYMLMLVPTYYILKNMRHTKAFPFLLILTLLSARVTALPGTPVFFAFFWEYYPLMIAYCIWGVYLYEIFKSSADTAGKLKGTAHGA